jgi:hypothetical protein
LIGKEKCWLSSPNPAFKELLIEDFKQSTASQWSCITDSVMGGVSEAQLFSGEADFTCLQGRISLANQGGFITAKRPVKLDLSAYTGIAVALYTTQSKRLAFILKGWPDYKSWRFYWTPDPHVWQIYYLPFDAFKAYFRGRLVDQQPGLNLSQIEQLGFLLGQQQAGAFCLQLQWIKAYGAL